jgi:hypothetical protein
MKSNSKIIVIIIVKIDIVGTRTLKLINEVTKFPTSHTISLITTILTCFHSLAKIPKKELTVNPAKRHPIVKLIACVSKVRPLRPKYNGTVISGIQKSIVNERPNIK